MKKTNYITFTLLILLVLFKKSYTQNKIDAIYLKELNKISISLYIHCNYFTMFISEIMPDRLKSIDKDQFNESEIKGFYRKYTGVVKYDKNYIKCIDTKNYYGLTFKFKQINEYMLKSLEFNNYIDRNDTFFIYLKNNIDAKKYSKTYYREINDSLYSELVLRGDNSFSLNINSKKVLVNTKDDFQLETKLFKELLVGKFINVNDGYYCYDDSKKIGLNFKYFDEDYHNGSLMSVEYKKFFNYFLEFYGGTTEGVNTLYTVSWNNNPKEKQKDYIFHSKIKKIIDTVICNRKAYILVHP